jgi:hypothetical protein
MPVLSPSDPPASAGCSPWVETLRCAKPDDTLENIARSIDVGTWVVWALSGRQYGVSCPIAVRPCPGIACAHSAPGHRRCQLRGFLLDLGHGVHSVHEVIQDGVVLPTTAWRLQDHRWLRRIDGFGWPSIQDFDLPTTEVGTLGVTFDTGTPPPAPGVLAVEDYACEVLAGIRTAEGRCKLPKRVRSIARQGVSIETMDPAEFLVDGRTGIDSVDIFARLANPTGSPEQARVWSPDYDSANRMSRA